MTDRFKGFVVALEQDLREDDAENTLIALRMVKGVLSVEPVKADLCEDHIIRARLLDDLREKIRAVLWLGI